MAKAYLQHGSVFRPAQHRLKEIGLREAACPHISRIQPKASSHAGSFFILQQWAAQGACSASFASTQSTPQGQVVPRLSHGEQ